MNDTFEIVWTGEMNIGTEAEPRLVVDERLVLVTHMLPNKEPRRRLVVEEMHFDACGGESWSTMRNEIRVNEIIRLLLVEKLTGERP